MSGQIIDLHGERLARIEGGKTSRDVRALLRDARTLLVDVRENVDALERLVAEEDRLAENVAAAEARRRFHIVK